MKKFIFSAFFVFLAAAGLSIGQRLSADAISMAIGIFFGVLASIPAALLVIAATRRSERIPEAPGRRQHEYPNQGYQAPVIVVSPPMAGYGPGYGQQSGHQPGQNYLPAPQPYVDAPSHREFRVFGGDDEWVEER